jgi:N,N'-diacetyllegionaminate synthase
MFSKFKTECCYIIAEIGGNFTTLKQGKKLVDAAADCGVDAIKLQTYRADTISSKQAMFEMENTGSVPQYELFKKYEVGERLHKAMFKYIESKELDWFSTPSHESDVDLLENMQVGAHKIGSDDAVNIPFLQYVASTRKPILLSTGMCTMDEVRESVNAILTQGCKKLILLHAITSYPTHPESVNLQAMQSLMNEFPQLDVGYSDHTLSPVACLCAVAMGARVIERHFTYDKNEDGPDHMLSADPSEMKWLVDAVRTFEIMKGDGIKRPAESEKITLKNNRKSVVLTTDLVAGEQLSFDNVAIKRPGYGIKPKFLSKIIGRKISKDMQSGMIVLWSDLV